MLKKISMVLLTLILAVIALLLAAKHPTGPNTVTFEEPLGVVLSAGMIVVLFLPPLILSFFNHIAVKIISAVYQVFFITFTFLGLILIGFFVPNGVWVIIIGILGAITSISSIIITIVVGLKNRNV